MAFVNFATREITAKIVYYGPGLGGKTTSLQYIHNNLTQDNRGKMISLATEEDRTIYFDFLPLHLGKIQDFSVRVQLYTVPGQVRYNATRKLVLRGADGLVFVADSQKHKKLANAESFSNMEENLREHSKGLRDLPHVLQFNKIDLPGIMTSEELNHLLNKNNVPFFETCATTGIGVFDSLKSITKLVFNDLSKKALLQKKTKTTTGTPAGYTMESAFVEKPQPAVLTHAPEPVATAASTTYESKIEYAPEVHHADLIDKIEDTYSEAVEPYSELQLEEEEVVEDQQTAEPDKFMPEDSMEYNEGQQIQEVEPIAEFDEFPATTFDEIPSATLVDRIEEEEALHAVRAASPEGNPFTYHSLFADQVEFSSLMTQLESQITAGQYASCVLTARAAFAQLLNRLYPAKYSPDNQETIKILALNIKFKRYVRFKRLLDAEKLDSNDLVFLHYFLTELYLSLKEL
jgi:hypothetical protein